MSEETKPEENFDALAEKAREENYQENKSDQAKDFKGYADQFEATLDEYMIKKAPFHIPNGGKEFLATIAPYLIIISAVIAIPAIIFALGLGAVLLHVSLLGGAGISHGALGLVAYVFSLISLVIEVSAVSGLFKRTHASWHLLYYASLVSFAGSILSLNIVRGIIGSIIGWYILFQVKALYKN